MTQAPIVIVLASGLGERFAASGGAVHKLQALLDGVPVLERTLAAVRASGLPWHLEDAGHAGMGDSIAAAVRKTPDASGWLILPADLPLVRADTLLTMAAALSGDDDDGFDDDEDEGDEANQRGGKLHDGEDAEEGAEDDDTSSSSSDASSDAADAADDPGFDVVVPVFKGQRGHPVGFAASYGEQLMALSGAHGAAALLKSARDAGSVLEVAVDDVGVITDIDTVQDLAAAEALWRKLGLGA